LALSKPQLAECKRKFCASPVGQLLNNSLKPVSALTGGLIGGCCLTGPSPGDLAKPGPEGAAAKIQLDEAEAKARRAAVRYLGTVDCHYWPDVAEPALIGALRADRSECVRLEAALALGRGCCCTKRTIAALELTVNGSDRDGNFAETSERVRAAAAAALAHCLSCFAEVREKLPDEPSRHVSLPPGRKAQTAAAPDVPGFTDYYRQVDRVPMSEWVEAAKRSLDRTTHLNVQGAAAQQGSGNSVFEIVARAIAPAPKSANPVEGPEPPTAAEAEAGRLRPVSATADPRPNANR
jgi:hypothetical protein